jgi:hypothetical protein
MSYRPICDDEPFLDSDPYLAELDAEVAGVLASLAKEELENRRLESKALITRLEARLEEETNRLNEIEDELRKYQL